ncbi:MAG: hypothetical protein GVY36_17240 [Verrucomicrobia bacterium]|nr:hypothetical protein [Verrucomicrobiota bacterium]
MINPFYAAGLPERFQEVPARRLGDHALRSAKMKVAFIVSAVTGALWGCIALFLWGDPAGMKIKIEFGQALLAGGLTGLLITLIFLPVYRFTSIKNLVWVTPVSLYLSIFVFTFFLQIIFYQGTDMKEIFRIVWTSWWALTLFFTLWPLFGLSLANHILVFSIIKKSDQDAGINSVTSLRDSTP